MSHARRKSIDHTPGRPQRWPDVDDDIREWIESLATAIGRVDAVVGIYLHGSLAMGGFYRPKSDLDLLAVTDAPLGDLQRRSLATELLGLFDRRPIIGGVELSVVRRHSVEPFLHPTPYEFHFGENWADDIRRGGSGPTGSDRDLAAHCTVVRSRGVALVGPPPDTAFGEVPRWTFLDAILDDLQWILDGGVVESPFYGVLNVCRCAQVLSGEPAPPPSKEEGGQWALEHLPEQHHQVAADALECYRSAAPIPVEERRRHGHSWDEQPLLDLAEWARTNIRTDS